MPALSTKIQMIMMYLGKSKESGLTADTVVMGTGWVNWWVGNSGQKTGERSAVLWDLHSLRATRSKWKYSPTSPIVKGLIGDFCSKGSSHKEIYGSGMSIFVIPGRSKERGRVLGG